MATNCTPCANNPGVYGTYTGPGTTATNCPVACNGRAYLSGGTCTPCAVGTYSAGGSATACEACVATLSLGYAFTSNGVSSSTCAVGCKANYVPRSLVITDTNKMLDWNGTQQAKIFSTTAVTPEGFLISPDQTTVLYVTSPNPPKIWRSTISEGSFSQSASFASIGTLQFNAPVSKIMFTGVWFSGNTYVAGLDNVGAGYWRLLKYTGSTWAYFYWYIQDQYNTPPTPNPVVFTFNKFGTIAYVGYQTYLMSYGMSTYAQTTIVSGFSNIGSGVLGLSPTDVFMLVFDAYSIKKVVMSGLTVTTLAGVTGSAASSDVDGVGTVAKFKTPVTSFAFSPDEAFAFMATAVGVRKIEVATGAVTTMSAATASYITMWNPCLPCTPLPCAVGKLFLANCTALSDTVCGTCANCSLGTYYVSQCTSDLGPPVCTNCSAGTFANTVNPINCTACALGSYASSSGLSACAVCPVGSTTLSTGATSVSQCLCAQDYYQSGTACVACRSCTNGYVDVRCPVGATSDVSTCKCNAGYYGTGLSCTTCKTCSANGYLSTTCPQNSTSDVSACQCNAGYYGTGLSCTACKTCSANGYLSATCPVGSTSDVSACACNAGYLGNGVTCVCPSGYYSSGSCLPCTNAGSYGTYTGPGTNATNCPVTCNAGAYLSGGFFCTPCAAGTYSAGGSATVCGACTNAIANSVYTSNGTSSSDCQYACSVGTYEKAINNPSILVSGDYNDASGTVTLYNVTLTQKVALCSAAMGNSFRPRLASSTSTVVYGTTGGPGTRPAVLVQGIWKVDYKTCARTVYTATTSVYIVGNGLALYQNETVLIYTDMQANKIKSLNPAQASSTSVVIAGSGTAGSTDGNGIAASFRYPAGIALKGTILFVAEIGGYRIRKIELLTGDVTTLWTGSSPSQISPCSMDVGFGSIWVSLATTTLWYTSQENKIGFARIQQTAPITCTTLGPAANSLAYYGTQQLELSYYGGFFQVSPNETVIYTMTTMNTAPQYLLAIDTTKMATATTQDIRNLTSFTRIDGYLSMGEFAIGSMCAACPAGATTLSVGSTSISQCVCPADNYSNGAACVSCKTCSSNGYRSASCPQGSTSDVSTCACNAGYYGTGLTCTACKTCSANGYLSATCPQNSTSDVSACQCNAGYYGTGLSCTACKTCSANGYLSATCPAGSTSDVSACACNAGYYGTGLSCTVCPVGSSTASTGSTSVSQCLCTQDYYQSGTACVACRTCPNGFVDVRCPVGATSDVSTCQCNAGYYFSGTTCSACKTCSASGSKAFECPQNSTTDVSVCQCNANYYGNGVTCTACRSCPANSILASGCPLGSTTDVTACQCNAGYYGNGVTCTACKTCSASGYLSAACPLNSTADVSACQCNAGYYGTGLLCTACRTCSAYGTKTLACPQNSTSDVSVCQCNAGYYGNGTVCTACKTCHANGTKTFECPQSSSADVSVCQCNAGYYGTGMACTACKTCSANGTQTAPCPLGSASDVSVCACNTGFYGTGVACSACRACASQGFLVSACPFGSTSDGRVCACNAGYYGNSEACTACQACSVYGFATLTCPNASTSDVSLCACGAGYFGNGRTCAPCQACSPWGYYTAPCLPGSTSDASACACNAGYYGSGRSCAACRACDANASRTAACPAGGTADVGACVCNAGYYGTGFACALCPANSYCSGGAQYACPTNSLSSPGASLQTQCLCGGGFTCAAVHDVSLTLSLDLASLEQFQALQDTLLARIAQAAGVPLSAVSLQGVTVSGARRRRRRHLLQQANATEDQEILLADPRMWEDHGLR